MSPEAIKALVRTVPGFPKEGIMFRDITTLVGHGEGFAAAIDWLAAKAEALGAQSIAGIEARGFIFGAPVAARLGLPFVPVRKPGKLPVDTIFAEYALEYGSDRLELDPGAIAPAQRVVMIDDLIATGGTAEAATQLVRRAGGLVDRALFVIELPDLKGAAKLARQGVIASALVSFDGH